MLSQTVFPPDIRLEREIRSLCKHGYKVLVVCNQYDQTKYPDFEFCKIERVKAVFSNIKLNRLINFPFFLNPRYLITTFKNLIRFKPDYIHAHDLPMMPIAIVFGKLFRIPIIFDMHENYPDALKYFEKKGLINLIFKNFWLAKYLEKICVRFSDSIIVVVEENKKRLEMLGVSPNKIFVVSNTVDIETFNTKSSNFSMVEKYAEKFLIVYSGGVSPDRGLGTPIRALKYFDDNFSSVHLIIIGNGPSVPDLKRIALEQDVENKVEFIPWPGHDNIADYLNQANILIIPQPNNEFINTTVPHKLFEYMLIGKPVLVSDAVPLQRIVNETKCGEVFNSEDENDFVKKVIQISNSNETYGENGMRAVKEKYNWKRDTEILLEMYSEHN